MSPRRSSAPAPVRLALVAAAAAITAALALPAGAGAAKPLYGVVPQDGAVPPPSDLELMPQNGIKTMRLMMHWASIEQEPGEYNWAGADAIVRETTRRGIQPMFFFFGTPEWAAQRDGRQCSGAACTVIPPKSDATRQAFADFATAAVKRYGPGGDFWKPAGLTMPDPDGSESSGLLDPCLIIVCPPIDPPPPPPSPVPPPGQAPCGCTEASPLRVWQILNEQNSPKYFAPKVDVKAYAAVVKAVGGAIKKADPGADVMLGGMWGPSSAKRVVTPVRPYLKKLYKIKGIEKSFDSIALHPYAANPKASLSALTQARRTLNRLGDRKVGVWVTEVGWASGGPKSNPYVLGAKGQAKTLSKAMKLYAKKQKALKLRGIYWYSWRDLDGGDHICDWCGHAGLRARDGSAKPAWKAFTRAAKR